MKLLFDQLMNQYQVDEKLQKKEWTYIFKCYTNKERHYHTLSHLENMYHLLNEHKNKIQNFESIVWAILYHDIIYNVLSSKNEYKSAKRAKLFLEKIGVDANTVLIVIELIESTASHSSALTNDEALFLDADLSILGSNPADYLKYSKEIRSEYKIYPDFIYNSGRKKVLTNFLERDLIYKTKEFKYLQNQAIINIKSELASL